jgi:hypothetical protein
VAEPLISINWSARIPARPTAEDALELLPEHDRRLFLTIESRLVRCERQPAIRPRCGVPDLVSLPDGLAFCAPAHVPIDIIVEKPLGHGSVYD